jgi:hypothetical protein
MPFVLIQNLHLPDHELYRPLLCFSEIKDLIQSVSRQRQCKNCLVGLANFDNYFRSGQRIWVMTMLNPNAP